MALYAIGDVQGCYDSLRYLLDKIQFSPEKDQLWFVGDLVNRGNKSLKTLKFVKGLGQSAITVLGNHDISLIAMHYGIIEGSPSLKKFLKSKHRDVLIDWLRHLPLLHVDDNAGVCMVHAGISPQWSLAEAKKYAQEVETEFQGDEQTVARWLSDVYGNKPNLWHDDLSDEKRHRYIINAFTRMRYCYAKDSALDFKQKGEPKLIENTMKISEATKQSEDVYVPWFLLKNRQAIPLRILFGHWSSLGFYHNENVTALDTGCVWGRYLTAIRVDAPSKPITAQACDNL